MQTLREIVK